jgi:hypothetical protein
LERRSVSTDIAMPENPGKEIDDLHNWVYVAQKTHQIALSLAKTSFVPTSMRGRPDEICGAILAGRELGLEPMAALRSIDIIDGTPAIRAVTLRALVQAQGHEVWVEESTMTTAVVCGIRKGETSVQKSVWTIERAKQAGLAGKKNWQNHPTAMLIARATAEVCRLIAADAILGMPYTSEEIRDQLPDTTAPAATGEQAPEPTRTFRRDPLPTDNGDLGDALAVEASKPLELEHAGETPWPAN